MQINNSKFIINSLKKKLDINFLIPFLFFNEDTKKLILNLNKTNFNDVKKIISSLQFNEVDFKEYIYSLGQNQSFMISKDNKFIDYGMNNNLFNIESGINKGDKAYKDIYDLLAFDIDSNLNLSLNKNIVPFKLVQDLFVSISNSLAFNEFSNNKECLKLLKNIKRMGGEYSKDKMKEHENSYLNLVDEYKNILLKDKEQFYLNSYFSRKNTNSKFLLKMKDIIFDKKGHSYIPLIKLTTDSSKEITGYQIIPKFGDKIFQGSPTGSCFILNKEQDLFLNKIDLNKKKIYLAEGMATAISIFKLLEENEQVVCTFNSGNLKQIYKDILKNKTLENHEIIICPDIDAPMYKHATNELKMGAGWSSLFELNEIKNNKESNPYNIATFVSKPIFPDLFRNDVIIYSMLENYIYTGKDLLIGSYSDFNDIENEFKSCDNFNEILEKNKNSLKNPISLNNLVTQIVDSPIIVLNDIGDSQVNDLKELVKRNNNNYDLLKCYYDENNGNIEEISNDFLNSNEFQITKRIFSNSDLEEIKLAKTKFLITVKLIDQNKFKESVVSTIQENIKQKKINITKIKQKTQDDLTL